MPAKNEETEPAETPPKPISEPTPPDEGVEKIEEEGEPSGGNFA